MQASQLSGPLVSAISIESLRKSELQKLLDLGYFRHRLWFRDSIVRRKTVLNGNRENRFGSDRPGSFTSGLMDTHLIHLEIIPYQSRISLLENETSKSTTSTFAQLLRAPDGSYTDGTYADSSLDIGGTMGSMPQISINGVCKQQISLICEI